MSTQLAANTRKILHWKYIQAESQSVGQGHHQRSHRKGPQQGVKTQV